MDTNIKKLREQWAAKLHELLQQRKKIDMQIMGIQQMLRGSAVLTEDPIPSEYTLGPLPLPPGLGEIRTVGLTDAVRLILKTRGGALTAKQIRDRLESYDYPLTQQNQMAAVHQVILRLLRQEEIRKVEADGKVQFEWINEITRAVEKSLTEQLSGLDLKAIAAMGSKWHLGWGQPDEVPQAAHEIKPGYTNRPRSPGLRKGK